MLRQGQGVISSAPVLWYGNLVDFGSFEEAIRRNTDSDEIRLGITLDANFSQYDRPYRQFSQSIFSRCQKIDYDVKIFGKNERTSMRGFELKIDKDKISVEFDGDENISKFDINYISYAYLFDSEKFIISAESFFPYIDWIDSEGTRTSPSARFRRTYRPIFNELIRLYRAELHGNVNTARILSIIRMIKYYPDSRFFSQFEKLNFNFGSWSRFVDHSRDEYYRNSTFERIRNMHLLYEIFDIFQEIDSAINMMISKVSYIGPSRATGQRYYRRQELDVGYIDPNGENFAMFLNSLNYFQADSFSKWSATYLGYEIKAERQYGHVKILLSEVGSRDSINLADMGYGFSQILPVMAQMWLNRNEQLSEYNYRIIAIEQPELHLHPVLQAKISDAIAGSIYFDGQESKDEKKSNGLHLIIETHSEAIINRFGDLISKKELSEKDIAIYTFNYNQSLTTVGLSKFDDLGNLVDWPFGFFLSGEK